MRALADRIPGDWAETVRQIARFGLVGIAATAVHSVVAIAYLETTGGGALPANLLGFSVAFSVSLAGNMLWVFPGKGRSHAAVVRFLAVALAALGVTCAISWLFDRAQIEPMLSLPVVLLAAPVVSYCGNRFWVFAR